MTFNNLTRADAVRIRDAIQQLEAFEAQQAQDANDARRAIAEAWWDTVKPNTPQTREEALDAYNFILGLLDTETDADRLTLLRQKLQLANEKFKERKKNG